MSKPTKAKIASDLDHATENYCCLVWMESADFHTLDSEILRTRVDSRYEMKIHSAFAYATLVRFSLAAERYGFGHLSQYILPFLQQYKPRHTVADFANLTILFAQFIDKQPLEERDGGILSDHD